MQMQTDEQRRAACAVSVYHANPANREPVLAHIQNAMGAWGYAESYIGIRFEEAMKYSPKAINGQYEWAMRQLASGSTEGICATLRELPVDAVRNFAEDFEKKFEACIG